jgi:hypothetical protein
MINEYGAVGGMINVRETEGLEENLLSAILSITKPTRPDLESKPDPYT